MKSVLPLLLFLFGWTRMALADSWMPAKEFEATSANGKFVAHILLGTRQTNAQAVVYSVRTNGRRELWRVELDNPVSPSGVFIPDDGSGLVTMDNWGRIGYGDNVAAIYGSKGLLANYSLEQFAPPPPKRQQSKDAETITISADDNEPYRRKFSHSTSSRHWRECSMETFFRDDGRLLFCLWLDWDERWVAWNMADGALMTVTPRQTERLNLIAHDQALEEIKSGKTYAAAYNFLGRTKLKEDRALIEEWLTDTTFGSGSVHKSSSEKPELSFTYTSSSYKRGEADRILARWDGIADDQPGWWHDNYHFLGTVRGQVRLRHPSECQGTLRIYLIPAETPLAKWAERQPQQYLTADLSHGPHRFENGRSVYIDVGERVDFMIHGVTPGQYRLKVVWDRAAPFCDHETVLCLPGAGDFVSITSPVFEAKKGLKTEGISIECTEPVK